MILLVALALTSSCVAASLRRIAFAAAPSDLDLPSLAEGARKGEEGVIRTLRGQPLGSWERAVADAFDAPGAARAAYLNECLTELDHSVGRWSRVPRVAASIASTSCFLLAAVALRSGLMEANVLDEDARPLLLDELVFRAVDIVAVGMAAATFCVAAQMRAQRLARRAREGADALLERLEAFASSTQAGGQRAE